MTCTTITRRAKGESRSAQLTCANRAGGTIDSQGALHLSLDPVAFKKTKHILRACEFVRDHVAKLRFVCRHLAGDMMIADILTKATARPIFIKLSRMVHTKMDDTYAARRLPDDSPH